MPSLKRLLVRGLIGGVRPLVTVTHGNPRFIMEKKNLGTAYKVVSTILLVPLSLVENLRNSNFLAIFLIYVLSNPEFPVLKEIQRFE